MLDVKRLNELKGEITDQFDYVEQVLQAYERGETSYEKVSLEFNKLHQLNGQISITIGEAIRDFFNRMREVKKERTQKIVGELGFEP